MYIYYTKLKPFCLNGCIFFHLFNLYFMWNWFKWCLWEVTEVKEDFMLHLHRAKLTAQMVACVCADWVRSIIPVLVAAWCHSALIRWGTVNHSVQSPAHLLLGEEDVELKMNLMPDVSCTSKKRCLNLLKYIFLWILCYFALICHKTWSDLHQVKSINYYVPKIITESLYCM